MKINLLLAAMLTVSSAVFSQQSPLYIMYESACMNKLDYKYRSGSATLLSTFSAPFNGGNQLLLMDVGLESKKPYSSAPAQTVRCNAINSPALIAEQINNKSRQVYIVRKRGETDYLITPVASATWVNEQNGSVQISGYGYAFKVNSNTTDIAENLSLLPDSSFIYLKSRETLGCKSAFRFNYEPNKVCACGEASALTFVSGLGFLAEDNSICETDKPQNGIDLVAVNGKSVKEWAELACNPTQQTLATAPAPIQHHAAAQVAPAPVTYNTSAKMAKTVGKPVSEINYAEISRPRVDIVNHEPIGPPPPPVYCTTVSGNGRHVVNKGETLYAISRKYDVPVKQLIAWNKLENPNHIQPCQAIYVVAPKTSTTAQTAKAAIASAPVQKKNVVKPVPKPAKKAQPVLASVQTKKATAAPKPVQHQAPSVVAETPVTYYAATEMTAKQAPSTAPVRSATVMHTVAAGESIYGLAKRYGYSTERFALMNGLDSDATLKAGQVLLTTDCTCPVERASLGLGTQTEAVLSAKSPEAQTNVQVTEYAYYKQPVAHTVSTVQEISSESQVEEVPSTYEFASPAPEAVEAPVATETAQSMGTPVNRESLVTYHKGNPITTHTVTEGDSLETLARKYKVTAYLLRTWNQLEENEVLVNGQLLVVQK